MKRYLFVYGTLMNGCRNHDAYLKGRYISKKRAVAKGRLYHLIRYGCPALMQGVGSVIGELYELENFEETIRKTDHLENYDPENPYGSHYIRTEITVKVKNNREVIADAYLYHVTNIDEFLENAHLIDDGFWKDLKHKDNV